MTVTSFKTSLCRPFLYTLKWLIQVGFKGVYRHIISLKPLHSYSTFVLYIYCYKIWMFEHFYTCFINNMLDTVKYMSQLYRKISVTKKSSAFKNERIKNSNWQKFNNMDSKLLSVGISNIFIIECAGFFCDGKPYFFHKLVYFQQLLKNLYLKLWYIQNKEII